MQYFLTRLFCANVCNRTHGSVVGGGGIQKESFVDVSIYLRQLTL